MILWTIPVPDRTGHHLGAVWNLVVSLAGIPQEQPRVLPRHRNLVKESSNLLYPNGQTSVLCQHPPNPSFDTEHDIPMFPSLLSWSVARRSWHSNPSLQLPGWLTEMKVNLMPWL